MSEEHVENLRMNIEDVKRLLAIHTSIAGQGKGKKTNVEVLNKSCLVLITACWEAFIEDLASKAFDFMLMKATKPNAFPTKVLTLASQDLKDSKNNSEVWSLAGDGWIEILKKHKQKILYDNISNFNTPTANNIDSLYENLIGLKNLSANWRWPSMSAKNSKKKLGELVKTRGDIAHRVSTSAHVHKDDVKKYLNFIHCLAVISNNRVAHYVGDLTKEPKPWTLYLYGKVK